MAKLSNASFSGRRESNQELLMSQGVDTAFVAGGMVGVVLAATVRLVPLVRYVALVAATIAIAVITLHGGISELIEHVSALQAAVVGAPTFSAGIISGALAIALIGVRSRRQPPVE
jgi:hypothetical protein